MVQPLQIRKFAGLYRATNPYGSAPEGALDLADNCVIRSTEEIEPRPGYEAVASTVPVDEIGFHQGRLLALTYEDPARSVTGQLRSWTAADGWTSLPMTPGSLQLNRPGLREGRRARFVSSQAASYFMSRYGLTKVEDLDVSAVCFPAVQPRNWIDGFTTVGSGTASSGTATDPSSLYQGFLATGFQCAYRVTIARYGANGELIESEPSSRIVVSNALGLTAYVAFTFWHSWMTPLDYIIRIWRSAQVASGTEPSDEMFLVKELSATGSVGTTGYKSTGSGNSFQDQTPDSFLTIPLYTNPTTGDGLASARAPAPGAADLAWFKDRMYALDTEDVQRKVVKIIGTGTGGLIAGARIIIEGKTFAFVSESDSQEDDATSGRVRVYTSGTTTQNIERTCHGLVSSINETWRLANYDGSSLHSVVFASYLGVGTENLGEVLLQRIVPGAAAFDVQVSSSAGWLTTGLTDSSDPNAQVAGLSWSELLAPEGWPTPNSTPVGDATARGYRLTATREALLIWKEDGVFKVADDGSTLGPAVATLDPTVHLIAPHTAVSLDNVGVGLCEDGVLLVGDGIGKVNVSKEQIERDLQELIAYVGRDTLASVAFAVANQPHHEYVLCLPESPNATSCTVQYVFNLQTRAWTRWTLPGVVAGAVNPSTGQLVWAMGQHPTISDLSNAVWIERNTGTSDDYQDPGFEVTCPASTAVATFAIDGILDIAAGDIIEQTQATYFLQQRVTAVAFDYDAETTTVTLDAAPGQAWSSSLDLTIRKGVRARVRPLPMHAGAPAVEKTWGESYLIFRYADFDNYVAGWATDLVPEWNEATEEGITAEAWAPDPFAEQTWSRQTREVILRPTRPVAYDNAAMMSLTLTFHNALARWALAGIDLRLGDTSPETVR